MREMRDGIIASGRCRAIDVPIPQSHDGGRELELRAASLANRAQVGDFDGAVSVEQQVLELDVSMHDAQLVHVCHAAQ